MKNVREVFDNELREMESGFLRKVFRIFILDYFREMIGSAEAKLEDIKSRAYAKTNVEEDEIVYQTIINQEEYIYAKDELFPYFDEDLIEVMPLERFNKGSRILDKAPLLLGKGQVEGLEELEFEGYITSEGKEHKFIFGFEKDMAYTEKEKKLKDVYEQNNTRWIPIYTPYSTKIYKIAIKDYLSCEGLIGSAEEIRMDLGEYEAGYRRGYFPVWNVKKEKVLSTSDSSYKPEGYYEHRIEISSENRIMVDLPGVEIIDIYKDRLGDIVVAAKTKNVISWDIWMVKKKLELNEYKEFRYQLVSNERNQDFMGKLKKKHGRRVRSEGEIHRLCRSFKALEGMDIIGCSYDENRVTMKVDMEEDSIYIDALKSFMVEVIQEEFWESSFEVE